VVAAIVIAVVAATAGVSLWNREAPDQEPATRPALTGTPLTSSLGMESQPAFSPDGRQLAYFWNGGPDAGLSGVYTKLIGIGDPLRLSDGADDYNPAWSPDGAQIAFLRLSGTRAGVMLVPALGGAAREVATVEIVRDPKSQLTWSPRQNELVLADVAPNRRQWRLQALNIETAERREITTPPPGWNDMMPRYSPDGRYLAFLRRRSGSVETELYVPGDEGPFSQLALEPVEQRTQPGVAPVRWLVGRGHRIREQPVTHVGSQHRRERRLPVGRLPEHPAGEGRSPLRVP
jgi:dipeptidyl aminopeptidase/acylaminoacyl peptidase